jgi:conjugative relaxase-like TrwC/TraI family protein
MGPRKGKNGVTRERGCGFVAAAYQHRTSRAQDLHLHTHVIVANMARGSDGEWRALDGRPILKDYRLAAGYLDQAQLRFELTRSLGVEWLEPEHGMAAIAGVPEAALRAFSQRRAQVLDYLERRGGSGFYAAKVAAIERRDRKEPIDLPRLRMNGRHGEPSTSSAGGSSNACSDGRSSARVTTAASTSPTATAAPSAPSTPSSAPSTSRSTTAAA